MNDSGSLSYNQVDTFAITTTDVTYLNVGTMIIISDSTNGAFYLEITGVDSSATPPEITIKNVSNTTATWGSNAPFTITGPKNNSPAFDVFYYQSTSGTTCWTINLSQDDYGSMFNYHIYSSNGSTGLNYGSLTVELTGDTYITMPNMRLNNAGNSGYPSNGFWMYGSGVGYPITVTSGSTANTFTSYYCDILNTAGITGVNLNNRVTGFNGPTPPANQIYIYVDNSSALSSAKQLTAVIRPKQ
jgi:hypothetical protein